MKVMAWAGTVALLTLAGGCQRPTPTRFTTGGGEAIAARGQTHRWTFDDAAPGSLPPDFISVLGDWRVEADPTAPSAPNVLRQKGSFADPDFPRAVIKDLTFQDLTLRVRCRPEAGGKDRACGLIFRLKDSDNYYVTRANALEDNVRLYRVVNGRRQQIGSANVKVTSGEWHTLEARAHGKVLEVSWDGKPLISATDATFKRGKIGLWTKADSVTAFEDLEATAE